MQFKRRTGEEVPTPDPTEVAWNHRAYSLITHGAAHDIHVAVVKPRNTHTIMLPGGGMLPTETSAETIIREGEEELGTRIIPIPQPHAVISLGLARSRGFEHLILFYHMARLKYPRVRFEPQDEGIAAAYWLSLREVDLERCHFTAIPGLQILLKLHLGKKSRQS